MMRVFVQTKAFDSTLDLCCHFANSVQRPSSRLAPVTLVHGTLQKGRVARKFQPSHAMRAVFPGPLQALPHSRLFEGNARSMSICQASGSTSKHSRTNETG